MTDEAARTHNGAAPSGASTASATGPPADDHQVVRERAWKEARQRHRIVRAGERQTAAMAVGDAEIGETGGRRDAHQVRFEQRGPMHRIMRILKRREAALDGEREKAEEAQLI